MRIDASTLALQSKNSAYSLYARKEQLQVSGAIAGQPSRMSFSHTQIKEQHYLAGFEDFAQHNSNSLQTKALQLAQQVRNDETANNSSSKLDDDDFFTHLPLDQKMKLLLIVELLSRFQKDPQLMSALVLDEDSLNETMVQVPSVSTSANTTPPASNTPVIEYRAQELLYQSETAQFAAQGQIKTKEGGTININLNLIMARETLEYKDTRIRLQAATKDPLVINFDGSTAELSEQRFFFDLTVDGTPDFIPQLKGNRAFLALDKNNDGVINNGTELFGALSGDGFRELAHYDDDKNGWIDEQDAVFNHLKLWVNAGSEQQKQISLKAANIGALYTGSAKTTFHLQDKDESQTNLGVIQSTGLFLNEDGSVGTIQHVDLTI